MDPTLHEQEFTYAMDFPLSAFQICSKGLGVLSIQLYVWIQSNEFSEHKGKIVMLAT